MPENNPDTELWILVGIVAAIILFGLLVGLCIFINDFSSELRYLNSEIGRTTGGERRLLETAETQALAVADSICQVQTRLNHVCPCLRTF